jgi:hypothetical protein
LKHIARCLMSALEHLHLSTVEVYCDEEGLQAPGSRSIPALVIVQIQRPDLVILDRSDHGRHRISLVELRCPWDTDTDKARDPKISKYADLKEALSNKEWDCGLFTIKVGTRGHISKWVKDSLWSLFWSWFPPGHISGVTQMIKYASWISLVSSFSIFRLATTLSGLLPVLSVIMYTGCWQISEPRELGYSPLPPPPEKKTTQKNKGVGHVLFLTHCLSHLLFLVHLLVVWFA